MKKLIVVFLSLIILLAASIPVVAEDESIYYNGARSHDDFLAQNGTQEESASIKRFILSEEKSETFTPPNSINSADTWKFLSGGFTIYGQQTEFFCGPATVQSALFKLNGSSPSQQQIANGCGTTENGTFLSPMITYLNNRISTRDYVKQYGVNRTDMINYLYSGLLYELPPIIGFACRTWSGGWLYNTDGHFVNINGCTTNGTTFNIADPLILFIGLPSNSFYNKSSTDLFNAYNSVNIGLAW